MFIIKHTSHPDFSMQMTCHMTWSKLIKTSPTNYFTGQERSIEKHLMILSQTLILWPKMLQVHQTDKETLISTCITVPQNCSLHDYGFSLDLQFAGMWQPGWGEQSMAFQSLQYTTPWSSVCRTQQLNLKENLRQHGACIHLSQSGPNLDPDTEEEASQQWSENKHEPP